jgi:OHCU decarboxylase
MTMTRPFQNTDQLTQTAEEIWWSLGEADWLAAFRCHPKIGERKAQQPTTTVAREWSKQEQAGVVPARETEELLTQLNQAYEDRFGYIFIVCASGKNATEILSLLRERIGNTENEELRIAAGEQAKITRLRLEKLLVQ